MGLDSFAWSIAMVGGREMKPVDIVCQIRSPISWRAEDAFQNGFSHCPTLGPGLRLSNFRTCRHHCKSWPAAHTFYFHRKRKIPVIEKARSLTAAGAFRDV